MTQEAKALSSSPDLADSLVDQDVRLRTRKKLMSSVYNRVEAMNLPKEITLPLELAMPGKLVKLRYQRVVRSLAAKYRDSFPLLVAFTWKQYWITTWETIAIQLPSVFQSKNDVDYPITPTFYMKHFGGSWAMASRFKEIETAWTESGLPDSFDPWNMMEALYCQLLNKADCIVKMDGFSSEWMDVVCDAEDARGMTLFLSDSSEDTFADAAPASIGAALADIRHAETRSTNKFVLEYWREKIDPALSAQKAADEVLQRNVVNLSHKKIAEIIAAERKRLGLTQRKSK
ncbi:hypothetical protein EHF36_07905 [Kerstersia gyiorum]|uniref:hypothetical protein n=1 Tax=Kerstersia gyiorum TaxID=206506 RepID=UPI0010709C4F|nr:hypothetical protein [Kerstersia gyiorum]QBR40558.1 hypothetical protein EHF36_07905 [Kerstersia gyiorum]